jgi:hypothetical protein
VRGGGIVTRNGGDFGRASLLVFEPEELLAAAAAAGDSRQVGAGAAGHYGAARRGRRRGRRAPARAPSSAKIAAV